MTKDKDQVQFVNREISWLYFNDRVLQEAESEEVPLVERARFLGIFSSNLDEFFRVRVATMKRMAALGKKARTIFGEDPEVILAEIQKIVIRLQRKFEKTYRSIIKEFEKQNIFITDEHGMNEKQAQFVEDYFRSKVRAALVPIMLNKKGTFPALKDKAIYLAIKLHNTANSDEDFQYALIEIPDAPISRFVELPKDGDKRYLMFIDDVIRHNLKEVFSIFHYDLVDAYTFKITRDAELDISEDISESLVNKLSKSVKGRKQGRAVRLVYDSAMPEDLFKFILAKNKLTEGDNLIAGGRYHNFKDLIDFPNIGGAKLRFGHWPPLRHPDFSGGESMLKVIRKKDVMLNYPYQSFNHVIDILREAAIHPKVTSIKMTVYRLAKDSRVVNALINAVRNGKSVTVVVELQARFDEENNIMWSNRLQEEGVKVIFGVPGLKVHAKLILIKQKRNNGIAQIAHVGTGNFNESTAGLYGDTSLLTADRRITNEVEKIFDFFKNNYKRSTFRHLFVSPTNTRRNFMKLIDNEISNVKKGLEGYIIIKINNIVDEEMIKKLYEASNAGVHIDIVVRGICSLVPGVPGMSENIRAIGIIDRFLEHSRLFVFHNGGDEKYFLSSADWMTRNLDKRLEVTAPIYDPELQAQLRTMLDMQIRDNTNARMLSKLGSNRKVPNDGRRRVRSQLETYKYFKDMLNKD